MCGGIHMIWEAFIVFALISMVKFTKFPRGQGLNILQVKSLINFTVVIYTSFL